MDNGTCIPRLSVFGASRSALVLETDRRKQFEQLIDEISCDYLHMWMKLRAFTAHKYVTNNQKQTNTNYCLLHAKDKIDYDRNNLWYP
ncbi:hypothetical protein CEXT_42381 [Caerostris extrusa]|uniref:Uncharacterized protein n=1 Tax=Caerostris extrusa TaxID=172846 RepID=A0AAV4S1L9_CAEEX|nr:hypothetical protein CEXT_42381 [Caerostris extrusa]